MADAITRLLTLDEVAAALRVSPHTVRSWVKIGKLRPVRLCRRLLFHPDDVNRVIDDATLPSQQELSAEDDQAQE